MIEVGTKPEREGSQWSPVAQRSLLFHKAIDEADIWIKITSVM